MTTEEAAEMSELVSWAIEDARTRHGAVIDLIRFADNQAMALLGLYVTLGIACVSGAGAGFGSAALVPVPVAAGLAAAAVSFSVGAWFCFQVMASATINLPGREAAFWVWASKAGRAPEEILSAYLQSLAEKGAMNAEVNESGTRYLKQARLFGLLAPVGAAVEVVLLLLPG